MTRYADLERQRLLALIDPWRETPTLPEVVTQAGAAEAHALRRRVGWNNWRQIWMLIGAWVVFSGSMLLLAIFGSLFMMSGAAGALPWLWMWLVGTVLFAVTPLALRAVWGKTYRRVYYDLSRSDLPLHIMDDEQWRCFLHADGFASGPGMVPQSVHDALRLATYFYWELHELALPGEAATWRVWLSLLRTKRRNFGTSPFSRAAMNMLLKMQLPNQEPEVNARYAAMYDYFFDPQREFHATATVNPALPSAPSPDA